MVEVHRRAPDGDADGSLLFVLGWGNRPGHEAVDWLLDSLTDAGWAVHAVELPENGTDFERDYVDPVQRVRESVAPDACAGHSLGGLTLAHLPGDDPRVYSAPFWGFGVSGLAADLLPAIARLPVERRVVPLQWDPSFVGDLKPADEDTAAERGTSPAWLSAIRDAQRSLPPFREGSRVHCTLADRVVSVRAIGERAPADAIRPYDGGHEFFASSGREGVLADFEADLRAIADH